MLMISAHQLRVHLQYIGYPIANDPLYSYENIWGPKVGRGGVEAAPVEPEGHTAEEPKYGIPESTFSDHDRLSGNEALPGSGAARSLRDREMANIDVTSPIRLSRQAKEIIAKLRRAKDEQENWVK